MFLGCPRQVNAAPPLHSSRRRYELSLLQYLVCLGESRLDISRQLPRCCRPMHSAKKGHIPAKRRKDTYLPLSQAHLLPHSSVVGPRPAGGTCESASHSGAAQRGLSTGHQMDTASPPVREHSDWAVVIMWPAHHCSSLTGRIVVPFCGQICRLIFSGLASAAQK